MKSFEETKTEIIEFVNEPRFISIFKGKSVFIKDKLTVIFKDISLMMDEDKDEDKDIELKSIELSQLLDIMMYNSIEYSISESEAKKIKNISQLIYNYNDNSFKDDSLKIRSTFLTNFLDGYLSLRESINLIRNLSNSLSQYAEFNPPSFELSKHYIDSIFGEKTESSNDL